VNTLNERIANLIQAEIDGALVTGEREELKVALAESPVARAYRAEMLHLNGVLGEVPDIDPPAGLSRRILDSIELPAPQKIPGWVRNWLQPASYGLAVAAGMLLAVGMLRLQPFSDNDMTSLVGSMVSQGANLPAESRSQLAVELDAVQGSISLKDMNGTIALQFDLVSAEVVEINIPLAESGLQFGGFVHDDEAMDVLEVSGRNVRVINQGANQFVVFLRQPQAWVKNAKSGAGPDLSISISQETIRIFKGTIDFEG